MGERLLEIFTMKFALLRSTSAMLIADHVALLPTIDESLAVDAHDAVARQSSEHASHVWVLPQVMRRLVDKAVGSHLTRRGKVVTRPLGEGGQSLLESTILFV